MLRAGKDLRSCCGHTEAARRPADEPGRTPLQSTPLPPCKISCWPRKGGERAGFHHLSLAGVTGFPCCRRWLHRGEEGHLLPLLSLEQMWAGSHQHCWAGGGGIGRSFAHVLLTAGLSPALGPGGCGMAQLMETPPPPQGPPYSGGEGFPASNPSTWGCQALHCPWQLGSASSSCRAFLTMLMRRAGPPGPAGRGGRLSRVAAVCAADGSTPEDAWVCLVALY